MTTKLLLNRVLLSFGPYLLFVNSFRILCNGRLRRYSLAKYDIAQSSATIMQPSTPCLEWNVSSYVFTKINLLKWLHKLVWIIMKVDILKVIFCFVIDTKGRLIKVLPEKELLYTLIWWSLKLCLFWHCACKVDIIAINRGLSNCWVSTIFL